MLLVFKNYANIEVLNDAALLVKVCNSLLYNCNSVNISLLQ